MKVYVVVECFLGGKAPQIKGVYNDRIRADEIKNTYRFSFVDEHNLVCSQEGKRQDVYVVCEFLLFNVPRVIGVYGSEDLALAVSKDCKYNVFIDKFTMVRE